MGQSGMTKLIIRLFFTIVTLMMLFEGGEATVQYLYYPVPVTPTSSTTYLRRSPGKSVHFQVRNPIDGTYHFGYDADTVQGDKSFREERRDAFGRVTGSYGYVDPDNVLRIVEYVADENGYRTKSTNQPRVGQFQVYGQPLQVIGPIPKPFAQFFRG